MVPGRVNKQQRKDEIGRRKKIFLALSSFLILTLLLAVALETILRLCRFKPWHLVEARVRVSPGGKLFERHPALGYVHIPGDFHIILGDSYSTQATHLPNSLRISHPLATYSEPRPEKEIWIFGCSYTYGWSLNNQDTYPWLLQERFPEYEIVNFGVEGYGTIHSLIQLREALQKERPPKIIVLAYADFHNQRNVFPRSLRKAFSPYNKLGLVVYPYAWLDANGHLSYHVTDIYFWELPLMRYSALSHFIEKSYNKVDDRYYFSRQIRISELLILEMAGIAQKNNIIFVIAGINASPETHKMLLSLQQHGLKTVDISVNLNIKENTNKPHDQHPSARANRQYADKLETFLRTKVFTR